MPFKVGDLVRHIDDNPPVEGKITKDISVEGGEPFYEVEFPNEYLLADGTVLKPWK